MSKPILAKVTPRTKIVFLANPNNPTGTYLPMNEVERLADAPAPACSARSRRGLRRVVTRNDYEAGIELVRTRKNVVMTRTFSKIYGLAALRLGWCYAPPTITDAINRLRARSTSIRPPCLPVSPRSRIRNTSIDPRA